MRKWQTLAAVCAVLTLPCAAVAQTSFGVGVKVGSIGVGGEAAVGLGDKLAIRGGGGFVPVDFNGTFSDIEFEVDIPDKFMNIGLDFYPTGGGIRLSGGLLIMPDKTGLTGTFTTSQNIGGRTYTPQQIGTLVGEIDSGSTAPFAAIGFGKHTGTGVGFYADLGAGFLKEPDLTMRQQGGSLSPAEKAQFDQDLARETQDIEDDLGGYLKIFPIIQVGLRIGLGG